MAFKDRMHFYAPDICPCNVVLLPVTFVVHSHLHVFFLPHRAGELLFLSNRLVLFLGNPMVKSLKELADRSLKISDIPRSDSTRELILLKHQRSTEFDLM